MIARTRSGSEQSRAVGDAGPDGAAEATPRPPGLLAPNPRWVVFDNPCMANLEGKIGIAVPPERVWATVLEDVEAMPRWAGYVRSARVIDGGAPGLGRRVRYELNLPGEWSLVLRPTEWERPRHAAGEFVDGPVSGRWSYGFASTDGGTDLSYTMEFKLGGMLRFAGRMLQSRYEQEVEGAMRRLKEYLEGTEHSL